MDCCVVLFLLALAAAAAQRPAAPRPARPGSGTGCSRASATAATTSSTTTSASATRRARPSQPIDGTVTIVARATQSLSRFDLDFAGKSLGGVTVDGARAGWRRDGQELVITPRRPLRKNGLFVVRVSHCVAVPTEPGDDTASTAFFIHADGSATAGQPDAEHYVFPSNDHPRDKATFTFRFDVPAGTTAVAKACRLGHRTRNGRTHVASTRQRQPMATELIQLAVGNCNFSSPGGGRASCCGTSSPPSLEAEMLPRLAIGPSQIDLVASSASGGTSRRRARSSSARTSASRSRRRAISLLGTYWFEDQPVGLRRRDAAARAVAHVVRRQRRAAQWSDIWLNEGHASWYEFVYSEEQGFLADDTVDYPDPEGYDTVDELMHAVYRHSDQWRHDSGPVAHPIDSDHLFDLQVYHGGALVLYALRQVVGARTFERIERAWVARYRDRVATTEDFIALASQVSHRDLRGFLRAWVYGTKTPPMPGHPDWKADPVTTTPPALAKRGSQPARPRR